MTTKTQHDARMVGPWVWASTVADSVAMVLEVGPLSEYNEWKGE
jgi:hypothetical protein